MTPRPIALLAAGLAGLVLVAVVVARPGADDEPKHDMHERHRVQLDLPPVEAALWFAAHYPQYFTSGEAGLGPWLAGLDPRDRDFVLALAQTLTWAWVEHELAELGPRDPSSLAHAATVVIRHKTLNQLELNVDHYLDADDARVDTIEFNAFLGDPEFAAGVFARLVRGVSNCEGQNHLLALLLDTALQPPVTGLPKIRAAMAGTRQTGHELVQLSGPMLVQPIYVDAWSNLPAFTLDPSLPGDVPSLAELGEAPPPVVPGLAARAPFSASVYAASKLTTIEPLSERRAPTRTVDLDVRAPALDKASLARVKDPWKLYLFARILHIYDDPRAADLYRLVLARHCKIQPRVPTFVYCAASTALLERL